MGVFITFGYFWKLSFIFIIQQSERFVKVKKVPEKSSSTRSSSYAKLYATDWPNRRQVVVLGEDKPLATMRFGAQTDRAALLALSMEVS